jgi:hypothetical protein
MNKKRTIGVILAGDNNVDLVFKCLSFLWFVDEIIITDTSDNDEIKNMLAINYPKAKHYFDTDRNIKRRELYYQSIADSEYLLFISYDEFITKELAEEIVYFLKSDVIFNGLAFRSIECSYGSREINEHYFTNRVIKKGFLKYDLDKNIHEELRVEEPIIKLKERYEHHSNPYLMVSVFKMFRYEHINASEKSTIDLEKNNLLNFSNKKLLFELCKLLLKVVYRSYKYRNFVTKNGFSGYCLILSTICRTIAENTCPTVELQFRKELVNKKDTNGFFRP